MKGRSSLSLILNPGGAGRPATSQSSGIALTAFSSPHTSAPSAPRGSIINIDPFTSQAFFMQFNELLVHSSSETPTAKTRHFNMHGKESVTASSHQISARSHTHTALSIPEESHTLFGGERDRGVI